MLVSVHPLLYCDDADGDVAPMADHAAAGLWCEGGGFRDGRPQAGWCRACPSTCAAGQGCHACDNDKSKMACGRSSLGEKASCAGEVAVETVTKLVDCLGLSTDGITCAGNLAKEIADCAGGGDCDVKFGDPCRCRCARAERARGRPFVVQWETSPERYNNRHS